MPSLLRPQIALAMALLLSLAIAVPAQAPASSSPAGAVSLLQPLGLAYDAAGNLLIAEAANHTVRRLSPSGTLTTIAGTGVQGFSGDGSPAAAAELDAPHALALDSAGNLFIADTHNNRIRVVDGTTGVISTLAGTGVFGAGGDGGPAISAQLASPAGLALDTTGLYIADTGNHRVRCVDLASHRITTVAGLGSQGFSGDGGSAVAATLDSPSALVLDSAGNLYVADTGNHRIRRIDATTRLIATVAGGSPASPLRRPVGLAIAAADLLIADSAAQRVLTLNLVTGSLSVLAGQGTQAFLGDSGLATAAMLNDPTALAFAPAGQLAIADTGNGRIRQVSGDGSISTIAGLGTLLAGGLTLSGATTQSYGSATLVAAMSAGSATPGASAQAISSEAQGSSAARVSLLDVTTGSTTLLAQASLATGLARFALPALSAGPHQLLATFPGDTTHRAAQSAILSLTVAPIPLTATLSGALTAVYGAPLPTVTATLSGALPADAGRLALAVTSPAAPLNPAPGTYPLQLTLSGPAAPNYTFSAPAATITVSRAPVSATLTQLASSSGSLLVAHLASSTSGTPTGSITLLTSAGTRLSTLLLDATGSATISTASLGNGSYTLSAIYSGDSNFLSAQSTSLTLAIGPPVTPADFSLTPSLSAAQTINAGATAQFTVAVKLSGSASLAGPITLSASGLPPDSAANFDPPIIPPGGAVTSFTLSVVTPRASAAASDLHPLRRSSVVALTCLLPFAVLLAPGRRRRRILLASLATLALCGCGARINSSATAAHPAVAYPILITGTTTNLDGSVLQHTATVTLTLQ